MNLNAGSLGGRFPNFSSNRLEVISVLINSACNLRCQHCYLNAHNEEVMRHSEFLRIFNSVFSKLAPSILCFAGREPLLDSNSVSLWSETIRLRDQIQSTQSRRTSVGIITNGMLVEKYADTILATPPDYIDVSIDGLPKSHDRIRGTGTFANLEPNLRWLTVHFPDRVWVTHTLFGNNIDELPSFMKFMHYEFGLTKFALGFYRNQPQSDPDLSLSGHLNRLGKAIEGVGEIEINKPVEVIIELGYDQIAEAKAFRRLGWEPPTQGGSSYSHLLGNDLVLRINSSTIRTGLWHSVRLSSAGYWVAAEDMLFPSEYSKRAVVNLRDCDYDTRRAYEIGLQHSRIRKFPVKKLHPSMIVRSKVITENNYTQKGIAP